MSEFKKNDKRASNLDSAMDVLQSLFKKSKTGFSGEYSRVRLEQNWAEIVGADLAKETKPRKIYKTTLYITTASSEARYHFRFSYDVIIKKINQFLGEKDFIKALSFKPAPVKEDETYSDKDKKFIDKLQK